MDSLEKKVAVEVSLDFLTMIGSHMNICELNQLSTMLREGQRSWLYQHLRYNCKASDKWLVRERLPFNMKRNSNVYNSNSRAFSVYNRLFLLYPNLEDLQDLPFVTHLAIFTNTWDGQEWNHIRRIAPTLECLYIFISVLVSPHLFDLEADMCAFAGLKVFKLYINSVCIRVMDETVFSLHPLFPMKALTHLSIYMPYKCQTEGVEILFALPNLVSISICDSMLQLFIPLYSTTLKEIHFLLAPDKCQEIRYRQICSTYNPQQETIDLSPFSVFPPSLELLSFQSRCIDLEALNAALVKTLNVQIIADLECHIQFRGRIVGKLEDVLDIVNNQLIRRSIAFALRSSYFRNFSEKYSFFSLFERFSQRACDCERTMREALKEEIKAVYRKNCFCCDICGKCREHQKFSTFQFEYERESCMLPQDEHFVFGMLM